MKIMQTTFLAAMLALWAMRLNADEAVVDPDAKPDKIAAGFKFTEGPVWHPRGFLLFSDIPATTIFEWQPGMAKPAAARGEPAQTPAAIFGALKVFRTPSGHSNGLAIDREGRLVACEHDRRVSRTEKDGSVVTLADKFEGKRLNSPNDLAIKGDGSIYFTDPPYGLPNGGEGKELDFNGVFRIAPDGKLSLLVRDFSRPNGIAFSPDERKIYIADSDGSLNHVRVFDVQPDGSLANGRVFAVLKEQGKEGAPDGIKVDERGNLISTGPGGIWIFSPDGKLLGKIATPEVPANLAFGDEDRKTLYITARTGLYRIRLNIAGHQISQK